MIDGVVITPLKQIHDERGAVYHMLREDAPHYHGFGELYFSIVNPGVVKGWKRHQEMVLSLSVTKGKLKLVLVDHRHGSSSEGEIQEIILGEEPDDYNLVTVPTMVWSGSKCLSDTPAIMTNCASIMHDPDEVEHLTLNDPAISYQW